MMKVGVTGGIGSGKSTVCRLFAQKGIAVYDSDAAAKRLMQEDGALRRQLAGRFGEGTFRDGQLDRAYLAGIVFADPQALADLNALVHPVVMRDFDAWAARQEGSYVILESAILFEAGLEAVSTRRSPSSRRANCASSAPAAATGAGPTRSCAALPRSSTMMR